MINSYEIKKVKEENLLILHLDYKYEIASDLSISNIGSFLLGNNIKWNGNKIILMLGDIIIGSMVLKKENENFKIGTLILNNFNERNQEIGYSKIEF